MIKVMLVDDDVPMLKYLAKLVPWQELGLKVVAEAQSAKRALQYLREVEPDLIVTDIGMPGMDGLELIKECKRLKPGIGVIFLTCHEEFHYARKAVQLDAYDYLLKDELTAEQLVQSLQKAIACIREDRETRSELTYKQDLLKNREMLKQQFFQQVVTSPTAEGLLHYGQRLGVEWKHPQFILSLGSLQYRSFSNRYRYEDRELLLYAISNISSEIPVESITITTFIEPDGGLVCVGNYQPTLNIKGMELFERYLQMLTEKVREFLGIDVYFSYGSPIKEISSMKPHYKRLKTWWRSTYYEGASFSKMPNYTDPLWAIDVLSVVGEELDRIRKAFKELDETETMTLTAEIKNKAVSTRLDPEEWKSRLSQWMRVLELEDYRNSDNSFHECLIRTSRLDDTMFLIEARIKDLIASKLPQLNRKPKIQQIEQYISEHLSEQLSLIDVANYLYLNPSYLSRYFKLETGMNFTDYLHRYKMKLACRLLKSKEDNIEIISLKLGYADRTYFSKMFKKYVGVSPKDYR
ncbi:response regulator [Paenibacillus sp. HWE-109]|uniref:response regulator transcription factor n=1 Tax=Paenibacillus sp. HWE-109 TaxID=1306526 RepID=UPI001EDDE58C|nr:response regulator [Paenibacillus sp. HWE-109]UKS26880.1 response regulator [Paenibacillus sp. HWE-109]